MSQTQVTGQQIKDNDITDADIAAANKDGAANVPSMRTLGTGALQAAPGNIVSTSNHWTALQIFELGLTSSFGIGASEFFGMYAGNATMTGTSNTGVGYGTLNVNTTGNNNTGVGAYALSANTTGNGNVGVGYAALNVNTTGSGNTGLGNDALYFNVVGAGNTGVGSQSLFHNLGDYNTAIGSSSLLNNITGSHNVAIGVCSLLSNTTGYGNTGIGSFSLNELDITDGSGFNTAIGYNAGRGIITGVNNTIIGANITGLPAGMSNTIIIGDGNGGKFIHNYHDLAAIDGNTCVGKYSGNFTMGPAGGAAHLGSLNTYIGYQVGLNTTTGYMNTFIGCQSGGNVSTGYQNTCIGYQAGYFTTTGSGNTAIGSQALFSNDSGDGNTAVGIASGFSNTTGVSNVYVGYQAGYATSTGSYNTVVGYRTLSANTTGTNNVAMGYLTMANTTTGSANTAIGLEALFSNITGGSNTIVGQCALFSSTIGVNNVVIGFNTAFNVAGESHANVIIGTGTVPDMTSGTANTVIGNNTGRGVVTGTNNTIIGAEVGGLPSTLANYVIIADGTGNKKVIIDHDGGTTVGLNAGNPFVSTGAYNTAIGAYALQLNTTGAYNAAVGAGALQHNTTGVYNNAFGYNTLQANTTGSYNVALGAQALGLNTSGDNNVAIGFACMYANETGLENTAIGAYTLTNNKSSFNSAFGKGALNANTDGNNNSAYGHSALQFNTTGNQNSAFGVTSLSSNTTGYYNSAFGFNALHDNTVGYYNTALGQSSQSSNISGNYNVSLGLNSLLNNTTGGGNVAIGTFALNSLNITAGDGSGCNTVIGHNTGIGIVTGTNNTIIGANVTGLPADLHNNVIIADGDGHKRITVDESGNTSIATADAVFYGSSTSRPWLQENGYGYSTTTYRVVQVGHSTGTWGISLGYDVSTNADGSFVGNEIVIPNNVAIIAPNATNDGWRHILSIDAANNVHIGNQGSWNSHGISIDEAGNVRVGAQLNIVGPTGGGNSLSLGDSVIDTTRPDGLYICYSGKPATFGGSVTVNGQVYTEGIISSQDCVYPDELHIGQLILTGATDSQKRMALGYDTTNNFGYIAAGRSGTGFTTLKLQPTGGDVIIGGNFIVDGASSFTGHVLSDVAPPILGTDAANKDFVLGVINGLAWKNSVRAATTVDGTLSTAFANGQVVDGVTLVTGNRLLIKNQTTGSENGIYTVNASGAPTRAVDADGAGELTANTALFVNEGGQADTQWHLVTDDPITIGTTALAFIQIGAATTYAGSSSILLTGNSFSVIFGTTSTTACVGNDARLSDVRVPIDLSVTDAKVAAANKDGTTSTPSMRTLGTGAQQAAPGNDARLSDMRVPVDLSVTDTKVAAANKDGTTSTPSMRTLGTGAQQAAPGNDSRLSDSRPPTGSAGGELAGTFPNPTLALTVRSSNDLRCTFDSSTTNGDPGSGKIRLNNSTLSAVTAAYINGTDAAGVDMGSVITNWPAMGGSGSFVGTITFYKRSDPSNYATYRLAGVAAIGFYTANLTYVGSHGTLATTAGDLGVQYLPAPRQSVRAFFRADKNAVDQGSIASNVWTKITFTHELIDLGNYYDASNSRWTPPEGQVVLYFQIQYNNTLIVSSAFIAAIYKNGVYLGYMGNIADAAFDSNHVIAFDYANGTDYYEAYVLTQGSTNIALGTITATNFAGYSNP